MKAGFAHTMCGMIAPFVLLSGITAVSAATIIVESGPEAQDRLQEALITAEPGDIVSIGAGRFDLTDGLSLDRDGVTMRGAGMNETILSFSGQKGSGEGLLVTSDRIVLEDFAVEDTSGDGIKAKGSDQITMRRLRVEWTGGPNTDNGAYALYPVESKNVLIEDSVVKASSDAGIYVGQSQNIIVRNNRAEFNVAGIEIENSFNADVFDNVATRNTGGILVFDLPNLKQMGGHSVRVFNNTIVDNDTPNFASLGGTVADVPMGTGLLVMANRNVHIFGNTFDNNAMVHVAIVSYYKDFDDDNYAPHPRGVVIRDNSYGKGGYEPNGEIGNVFAEVSGRPVPDIVWDGVTPLTEWLTWTGETDGIFVDEDEKTTFANLRMISNTILPWDASPDRNKANYSGSLPEPEAVKLPQDASGS
jgi:parallel beta-helix repeat protein